MKVDVEVQVRVEVMGAGAGGGEVTLMTRWVGLLTPLSMPLATRALEPRS